MLRARLVVVQEPTFGCSPETRNCRLPLVQRDCEACEQKKSFNNVHVVSRETGELTIHFALVLHHEEGIVIHITEEFDARSGLIFS